MLRARAALLMMFCVSAAFASGPLFPAPLHLTRQVLDPISNTTTVLEEYAYGNRLISIHGSRTSIADYEKGELTEIDRDRSTYSVTRFDALARATQNRISTASVAPKSRVQSAGVKATKTQRSAEFFVADFDQAGAKESIEIGVDRSVRLSRQGLEVLIGAAYPGVRTAEHDAVLSAAAPAGRSLSGQSTTSSSSDAMYALPVEQTLRYEIDGQPLEMHMSVVRIGSEAAPADLIAIPAGAQRVTSRIIEVRDEIERLDHPSAPKEH